MRRQRHRCWLLWCCSYFHTALLLLVNCNLGIAEQRPISLCPVTSHESFTTNTADGRFLYPLDLFAPELLKNSTISKSECFATDWRVGPPHGFNKTFLSCPDKLKICPIILDNIDAVTAISKPWTTKATLSHQTLCHLKRLITTETKRKIRVLTFGNSVTIGYNAGGCCKNETECSFPLFDVKDYLYPGQSFDQ